MATTDRYQAAKRATIVNATTNTLLAIFKIIVGYFGHSTALIADGIHSFSDLISDSIVLIASKFGTKHPDKHHPYGHQRIETIATLLIALTLIFVAGSILYDAVLQFLKKTTLETPSFEVILVAFVSIIANECLFRYTLKKGKSVRSNLLITNAWHNRSDVYVSIIVLITVTVAWLGWQYFDAIGATIVALLILKMGGKMIWSNLNELIDASADEKTITKIQQTIESIPGVCSVHQLRTRLHSGNIFVDVHIIVNPKISVSEGHHIGQKVHLKLFKQFKNISDITVHVDPEDDETSMPSVHLPLRAELQGFLKNHWESLPGYALIQDIQLHYLDGKLHINLVMPLNIREQWDSEKLTAQYLHASQALKDIEGVTIFFV